MDRRNLLILGGTEEARQLAIALAASDWQVTTSLAGRTSNPAHLPGQLRVGGFGGVAGLEAHLKAENIKAMIDATHPFAERMSAHAREACQQANCPLLRLERPEWQPVEGDDWHAVSSVKEAVKAAPPGARLFLTLGRQEMALFAAREDITFIARMIEPPDTTPANGTIVLARPPFTYADEFALMESRNITHLVSRNSGGDQTAPKLNAARDLGMPVIMITRPPSVQGIAHATTPAQAINWLDQLN